MACFFPSAPHVGYVSQGPVSVKLYRRTDLETSDHLSGVRITDVKPSMPRVYPGLAWIDLTWIGLTWIQYSL